MSECMRTLQFVLTLSAVVLAGCDQPRSALSSFLVPTFATHDLSGTVSSTTGEPITSATVTFTTGRRSTGVTAANKGGFYQIRGLEPGTVVVTMSANGYLAETRSVAVTGDLVLDVTLDPLPIRAPTTALP